MLLREMRYLWTRLQVRRRGLKVKGDGVKGVPETSLPPHRTPEVSVATQFPSIYNKAFRERLDNIYLFGLNL